MTNKSTSIWYKRYIRYCNRGYNCRWKNSSGLPCLLWTYHHISLDNHRREQARHIYQNWQRRSRRLL